VSDSAVNIVHVSKTFSLTGDLGKTHKQSLKAVDQVSLTIQKGEVCGIIGENGSGKSTLLKMISEIYAPDEGRIEINGKLTSIIELGTGFHPDLSGRDNIFFYGGVLGYATSYLESLLHEIISFSELQSYIDAPVKTYSSGMYMRLAFSIASHLQSDILILDEIFSVGDQNFRSKCLAKLKALKKAGVTILLVSHDFYNITSLCDRCILLKDGRIVQDDLPQRVVDAYISRSLLNDPIENENGEVVLFEGQPMMGIDYLSVKGSKLFKWHRSDEIRLNFQLQKTDEAPVHLNFALFYRYDELSFGASSSFVRDTEQLPLVQKAGRYDISCNIPGGLLNVGTFILKIFLTDENYHHIGEINKHCLLSIEEDKGVSNECVMSTFQGGVFSKLEWLVNVKPE
jgi:ABC-type polysaccharide/polyol phosphate transport system ATPase subunit